MRTSFTFLILLIVSTVFSSPMDSLPITIAIDTPLSYKSYDTTMVFKFHATTALLPKTDSFDLQVIKVSSVVYSHLYNDTCFNNTQAIIDADFGITGPTGQNGIDTLYLQHASCYFWRVRLIDSVGNASAWYGKSAFQTFVTAPLKPISMLPANNTILELNDSITFSWQKPSIDSTTTSYILQICDSTKFQFITHHTWVQNTTSANRTLANYSITLPIKALTRYSLKYNSTTGKADTIFDTTSIFNRTYHWRVEGVNAASQTYSDTLNFTLIEKQITSTKPIVKQIFTTLSKATVTYDVLGRKIQNQSRISMMVYSSKVSRLVPICK
jgi:hypothetical protein